eukprot:CAMPEP_0174385122 /NCGR_PEP_ID=MMETSP0811_2-20130205/126381_1 /TAXON_ID=73025 ORGANISM="Eutreptiella gymnastica-like, Strain CCMP1594" /NCGR_SAMPLE_ID=MMETSP0811_2 /ASSEMBLY_ACC=CAM_ASM_000667 /LENGTH=80 /DNA_ID=CAMNT_0015539317 /DNA_START=1970 /DNA_END=2212 /DNA_ORIENTATION=-
MGLQRISLEDGWKRKAESEIHCTGDWNGRGMVRSVPAEGAAFETGFPRAEDWFGHRHHRPLGSYARVVPRNGFANMTHTM